MGTKQGRHWLMRFSGLAFRISSMVFVAALFTSLVVTSVSVHSLRTFLRGEIERKLPELLERASTRLDLWYEQRERDIDAFARSEILTETLISRGQATRSEASWYLSFVLERFPQYSALFLLDDEGRELLVVGAAPKLHPPLHTQVAEVDQPSVSQLEYIAGRRVQLVSAPIHDARGERLATLHAVLRLETLEPLLNHPEMARRTMLQLVDQRGRILGAGPSFPPRVLSAELPGTGEDPEITITENAAGERIVARAIPIPRFGWTLVALEPYDDAFAPIAASVRRTLGINLLTVLLSSAGAFVFAAWRVRPILALSEGVRRISEGETEVEVPESGSGDEIQILARTFNQMSARLRDNRLELESRNLDLQRANEALEQLSITDSLTRLHNHRFFQDQFAREAKRSLRSGSPLCLVLIDIDDFKSFNDWLGHAAGDAVLERIARIMSAALRESDVLCRYGGEEFALLSPQTDLPGAISLAEKIRSAVAEGEYAIVGPDGTVRITVSIGVAQYAQSTGDTFNRADRALYDAKAAGKDCVVAASISG